MKVLRPGFGGQGYKGDSSGASGGLRLGLDSSRRYSGTTAQALLSMGRGDAVLLNACGGGYHAVDYSRIDVDFKPAP